MILFIKNHIIWFPSVQHCNWFGFRISLSLSREGAIFRDEIENYFSCSRLARRDQDYHMTILVFRDENEIPFCYSHVSRRDRDFRKSFLVVEREKMKLTLVENSWDREFSLTSGLGPLRSCSSAGEIQRQAQQWSLTPPCWKTSTFPKLITRRPLVRWFVAKSRTATGSVRR